MAWTKITRPKYQRDGLRYSSDCTDAEWALIKPFMLKPAMCRRPRESKLRDVGNAVFYIAQSGCQWRMLPNEFPPHSTVQRYFYAFRDNGLWRSINHMLLMATREAEGREASLTVGVIASQLVKTTQASDPRGNAADKDDQRPQTAPAYEHHPPAGGATVHPANLQDRDAAADVLARTPPSFSWLRHVFADAVFAGDKLRGALAEVGGWTVEIIKRSDAAKGFVLLPRR